MLPASGPVPIVIETEGVPLDWMVYLRVVQAFGPAEELLITDGVTNPLAVTGGPSNQARVTANVTLADGYTALQARAVHPTMAP